MTQARQRIAVERRDTIQVERDWFAKPDIRRVRILGINALGVLHRHAGDLIKVLRDGGTVEVLLLDPESAEFRKHRDAREKRKGRVSNRLSTEMEASIAILRDILNLMLHEHDHDIETLNDRFRIRFYDRKADKSFLFVETPDHKHLAYRKVALTPMVPGEFPVSNVVSAASDEACPAYTERLKLFHECWKESKTVSLDFLTSNFHVVSPRERDAPHIYAQAVELHKQRRLDEASTLYKAVLRLEKPRKPTKGEAALARRFIPRVFTTAGEPFALKDLVVVIHPDKTQRLIGYHLVWEDDIDFLSDNDPADHEVVWVRYSKDQKVEGAWTFWHGKILLTSKAVPDANASGCRVRVNVQWGKHGSLLEGWEEKIGVDTNVPGFPDFDPMPFSRLKKERGRAEGHYADRWPKRFEGELDEFVTFPVELDMNGKLDEQNMIVVSRYANAVISQWYLPYNIRPKADWPHGDTA